MYILTEITPQCVSTMPFSHSMDQLMHGNFEKVLAVFQGYDMFFNHKKVFPLELS